MKPTCVEITVTLDQAEADFSNLVHQASAGQPITITQYGRALARLIAIEPSPQPRIGAMKGKWVIPEDFDALLPEDTLNAFERRSFYPT